jgi:hypothetical protein
MDLGWLSNPAVSGQTVYASGWYGIVALDPVTGDELAADGAPLTSIGDPTVDEECGLVRAHLKDADNMEDYLCAWTTETLVKKYTIDVERYFVAPSPTLGWDSDSAGNVQPAVFAVANDRDLSTAARRAYAVNRSTGVEMWRQDLPAQLNLVGAAYSGGKLFISTLDHRTPVLGTYNHGEVVDILNWGDWTWDFSLRGEGCPVIAEVNGCGVMYFFGAAGSVVALSTEGANPPPQVFPFTVAADPLQIGIQSTSTVMATFVDNKGQPIAEARVSFSCDAGNNQGYLSPTVASTDASGKAVTTYVSGKQQGTVTVTATTPGAAAASVAITVSRGSQPPAVGTIQGTVYDAASKPVKDARVTATEPVTKQATTNSRASAALPACLSVATR